MSLASQPMSVQCADEVRIQSSQNACQKQHRYSTSCSNGDAADIEVCSILLNQEGMHAHSVNFEVSASQRTWVDDDKMESILLEHSNQQSRKAHIGSL